MRFRMLILLLLSLSAGAAAQAEDQPSVPVPPAPCRSAEACYRAANEPVSGAPEQRRRVQLERLIYLREHFPDTLWSLRAGVIVGWLMFERDPVEAARLFAAARSGLSVLEDYLQYWEGEARLRAGEVTEAAQLLESIPAFPNTLLGNRSKFAAGHAWFKAAVCRKALPLLQQAVGNEPQDAMAPAALLEVGACQLQALATAEGRAAYKRIWIRYPNTPAAREALLRLNQLEAGGAWHPTPDELLERAQVLSSLALFAEAADDLQRFLAASAAHPRREEAKLKLTAALIRLKRYEQARPILDELLVQRTAGAGEAAVSLARIYLRQGDGERLLALREVSNGVLLSSEQRAALLLLIGSWLEDQRRFDEAVGTYRQVLEAGPNGNQKAEALWRIAWIHYRNRRWAEAGETLNAFLQGKEDPQWVPQALYWRARALERQGSNEASLLYQQVCRQYTLTYYCPLARGRVKGEASIPILLAPPGREGTDVPAFRSEVERDVHYQKASELRLLRRDADAARELLWLTERYARDQPGALVLSSLLSDAGAHSEALRLARLTFRDVLERGGGDQVPPALWAVAYPAVYLPSIRVHASARLDPYLAAAIIREESQYDTRAVSRVGAIGLMQLMPETARSLARPLGTDVVRDELFDQETNIRYGTRYLDQLLDQFSDQAVHAIAAYNAGPVAVSSWIAKNGAADWEEFVEMIPYQETRQYVKRVLRSYWEYRRVYGAPCRERLLDKVC